MSASSAKVQDRLSLGVRDVVRDRRDQLLQIVNAVQLLLKIGFCRILSERLFEDLDTKIQDRLLLGARNCALHRGLLFSAGSLQ